MAGLGQYLHDHHHHNGHQHLHSKRSAVDLGEGNHNIPTIATPTRDQDPYLPNGAPRLDDFVYEPPELLFERQQATQSIITASGAHGTASAPAATATGGGSRATASPASTCIGTNGKNLCHYNDSDNIALPIVLALVIPIVLAVAVLVFLHFRNRRKLRAEDAIDKHGSLDFGLGENHRPFYMRNNKRLPKAGLSIDVTEKSLRRGKGVSLDIVSPYLPPEIHSARSSQSMSRTALADAEDPFRTVSEFAKEGPYSRSPSRVENRAPSRLDDQSLYTMSSHVSDLHKTSTMRSDAASSITSPPDTAGGDHPPLPDNSLFSSPLLDPSSAANISRKPLLPSKPDDASIAELQGTSAEAHLVGELDAGLGISAHERDSHAQPTMPEIRLPEGDEDHEPHQPVALHPARGSSHAIIENADSVKSLHLPNGDAASSRGNSAGPYDEWATYADVLGIVQKESNDPEVAEPGYYEDVAPIHAPQHEMGGNRLTVDGRGLGVPNRFSSLRPLPPDDPNDTAEQRANRIRSFYREYFDGGADYDEDGADYYEDYSQEYLNGATIWDPETGQFIVANAPYADPITRRAMTPPPRGPPRFRHGGSQPPNDQSRRPRGQRAFSSASARPLGPGGRLPPGARAGGRGQPKGRPLPPPSPLQNLPTPYLLKDDFAFTASEFAPASNVKDHRIGRTDSPLLGSKPYSPPSVRAYSPLISSFNTLLEMPSPHALRKSSTFTGLDFAAPPRFRDVDTGSDAASLRSHTSNMSPVQLANVRAGAYRLSRIPKEVVGTRDDLAAALKPSWDLR